MEDIEYIDGFPFHHYRSERLSEEQGIARADAFHTAMLSRRSIRKFDPNKAVSLSLIQQIVLTAASAPSGANKQPWTFCIIGNAEVKAKIRAAAEKEERKNYDSRMNEKWIHDLAPLGTNWQKTFLTDAPWLIAVFRNLYEVAHGQRLQNYYTHESVGIACGFLIAAIHLAGLATVTHTPSPMNFLSEILQRPSHERPFLLLPVGYAAEDALVPQISKKSWHEIGITIS